MSEDRELQAMAAALAALQPLENDERKRVMTWLTQKLALDLPSLRAVTQKIEQGTLAGKNWSYTTDTVATILHADSGPELIMAAAAQLHFCQGKTTFTRQEIAAQMKAAPSHFKSTFINNLSSYLSGLTRADRLRLSGHDVYALPNKERQDLEAKLAAAE